MLGGYNGGEGGALAGIDEYDPAANVWRGWGLTSPRQDLAAVRGRDGQMYALGGRGRDGLPLATFEESAGLTTRLPFRTLLPFNTR